MENDNNYKKGGPKGSFGGVVLSTTPIAILSMGLFWVKNDHILNHFM